MLAQGGSESHLSGAIVTQRCVFAYCVGIAGNQSAAEAVANHLNHFPETHLE